MVNFHLKGKIKLATASDSGFKVDFDEGLVLKRHYKDVLIYEGTDLMKYIKERIGSTDLDDAEIEMIINGVD